MNAERLLTVADAIEHHTIPDLGFNMFDYRTKLGPDANDRGVTDMTGRDCGTVACIAGWAAFIDRGSLPAPGTLYPDAEGVYSAARYFLHLSDQEADDLFMPLGRSARWAGIRTDQAVAVLRHAAATGVINWARVLDAPAETEVL